eukprot:1185835-Prorocentrum_minimum.AAC.2
MLATGLAQLWPAGASSLLRRVQFYKQHGVLHRTKTVLAFGDGTSGVLGEGDSRLDSAPIYEAQPVHGLPKDVRDIVAGMYHNLAITNAGALYAWGRNAEGQPASEPEVALHKACHIRSHRTKHITIE